MWIHAPRSECIRNQRIDVGTRDGAHAPSAMAHSPQNPTPQTIMNNAQPAINRDMLMQPEPCQQGDNDISERRSRKNKGKVSPAQSAQITRKESEQAKNSGNNPGFLSATNSSPRLCSDTGPTCVMPCESSVSAHRCRKHHGQQDEIALQRKSMFHRGSPPLKKKAASVGRLTASGSTPVRRSC